MKPCWVPVFSDTDTRTPEEKTLGLTDGFFAFSCAGARVDYFAFCLAQVTREYV